MSEFNENNQENMTEINQTENPVEQPTGMFAAEPQPAMDGAEIVSGVEVAKKSKFKIAAIIAVVIVLIFGAAGASYALIPQVKNTVKMLVNSPAEYYQWVESENTDLLNEVLDELDTNTQQSVNSKVDLSLNSKAIAELAADASGEEIPAVLNDALQEIKISAKQKGMQVDGYYAVNEKLAINDTDVLTYNAYSKDGKLFYQIPELSSSYISFDFAELMEAMGESGLENEGVSVAGQALMKLTESMTNGEEIISKEDIKTLITTYSEILFKNIENVKLEKNVKCEAGGVKTEYTKLVANIDEGTLYAFLKDALKELKNDKIVIDFVVENLGISKDEYKEAINSAYDEVSKYDISGGDDVLVMDVLVNGKGEIVGRTFKAVDGEETVFTLGYSCVNDGDDYGINAFIDADDEKYSIDGKLTEGKNGLTGDINVADVIVVSVKDLSTKDDFVKGDITLGFSALDIGLDDMTMKFDAKDDKQLFSMDVSYEGTKLGGISAEASTEKPESITVFTEDAKVYSLEEIEQYLQEIDLEGFLTDTCKSFGMDDAMTEQFVQGFMEGFSGSIDGGGVLTQDPVYDMTEEYNPDEDPYVDTSAEYDLSKVKIQLDGKDITLPGKIDGLTDKVKFEKEMIEAGGYDYGFDEDYNITVSINNLSDKEAKPADCEITSLAVSEDSGMKLSVDGITFGDDINKVVEKYGCKLEDTSSGFVDVNDTEEFNYITFYYMDGKIYEINLDF